MSNVTWGVSATREATVFCMDCRAVLRQSVPVLEAIFEMEAAAANHHCTPTPQWRPRDAA